MNIIEVKNNLVKLCYEEDLELSSLVLIKDTHKIYIAQILYLEATRVGKVAVAKLIFNYENGLHAYDGSIPTLRAEIEPFDTSILLNTFEHSNPLTLGKIAGKKDNLTVDFNILKDNPIILAEKFFITKVLLNNLALQIQARKGKIVVFDTTGIFKSNKLTVTKDFKLPLNASTINYIYEKGFEDATAESKSMIQAIFEDLSEYSKTVEFIPFDTFKAVIDSEFMRTKLMQLVILKNKIKQIKDQHIFAQQESEFKILQDKFMSENTVVLDISCLQESLQQECIKYVYSVLKKLDSEFYAFTPVTNENSDKFLLQQIHDTENVHTTMICGYDYAYLNDLKRRSKNMLMFTPLKQQKDFGGYNIFLHRLAEDEFIAYGKMTKFVPLIAKLFQMTKSDAYVPSIITNQIKTNIEQPETAPLPPAQPAPAPIQPQVQIQTEEAELPNVAPIEEVHTEEPVSTEPEVAEIQPAEPVAEEPQPIPQPTTEVSAEPETTPIQESVLQQAEEPTQTVIQEPQPVEEPQELSQEEQIAKMAGATAESVQAVQLTAETVEPVPQVQTPPVEEIPTPAPQVSEPAPQAAETAEQIEEEIPAPQEPAPQPAEPPITEEPAQPVAEDTQVQEQNAPSDEVQAALDSVPDVEDDEELSDDDLDMIEELSKPDEEIPAINQEQPQPSPTEEIPDYVEPQAQQQQPQQQPQRQVPPPPQPQQPQPQPIPQPLETKEKQAQSVPQYSAEFPDEDRVNSDALQQGDRVFHQEFGEGVVEKMINYGDKVLCSVNFTNVGRRLLNPEISEMKKI